jgi:hypothetical protein
VQSPSAGEVRDNMATTLRTAPMLGMRDNMMNFVNHKCTQRSNLWMKRYYRLSSNFPDAETDGVIKYHFYVYQTGHIEGVDCRGGAFIRSKIDCLLRNIVAI